MNGGGGEGVVRRVIEQYRYVRSKVIEGWGESRESLGKFSRETMKCYNCDFEILSLSSVLDYLVRYLHLFIKKAQAKYIREKR
jgi:hypothetical protein